MSANEIQGDGRPVNQPGLYRQKETNIEIVTAPGSNGRIQADAMVQQGFVRVGDIPTQKQANTETSDK